MFIRVESQLVQANCDLSKKLEEKSGKIKELSEQINLYDANLNIIKEELKDVRKNDLTLFQTM
jgi:hypothetical protein